MRMKRLLTLIIAIVSIAASATNAPLTANLQQFTSTPANAFIQVTLKTSTNCVLSQISTGITIARLTQPFFPNATTGIVTTSVIPTTDIACNGLTGAASYNVAVIERGTPNKTLFSADYLIPGTGITIGVTTPIAGPPPAPVIDYVTKNTANILLGSYDFTGASVVGLNVSGSAARRFIPSGTINGANTVFTFVSFPSDHTAAAIYRNGVLLTETDDYTVSGTTVTFVTAPKSGDHLFAYY